MRKQWWYMNLRLEIPTNTDVLRKAYKRNGYFIFVFYSLCKDKKTPRKMVK